MPNRIQALLVTCLVASGMTAGLAGNPGGEDSISTEVAAQANAEPQQLAVRAQLSHRETQERTPGRYCRPLLPESLVGRAGVERQAAYDCIEDSRLRPARFSI